MKRFLLIAFALAAGVGRAQEVPDHCVVAAQFDAGLDRLIDQYETRLGFYKNPFIFSFTVQEANAVYDSLLHRSNGLFCSEAPLFRVHSALQRAPYEKILNADLMRDVIQDAKDILSDETSSISDLQSNIVALKTARSYLAYYGCADKPSDTTDNPKKDTKEETKKHKKPATYPESMGQDYKPHTKQLDGEGQSSEETAVITEANFKTAYFGNARYARVMRKQDSPLQKIDHHWKTQKVERATGKEERALKVRTLGKKAVSLFVPPNHYPLQPLEDGARIEHDGTGSYTLFVDNPVDTVTVPVRPYENSVLSTVEKQIYTQPIGFDSSEWPESMQQSIIHKYEKNHHEPNEIARALSKHLAENYRYATKRRAELDPVDALKSDAFQCDMAAYIMVSVLRDVYEIPCLVVAGFRAKKHGSGHNNKSYLIVPQDGHAWVEVFHDGAWHPYDPTSIKKEDGSDKDKKDENSPYSDRSLDEDKKSETSTEPDTSPREEKPQPKDGRAEKGVEGEKSENVPRGPQESEESSDEDPTLLPELVDALGELQFEEVMDTNPLRKYVIKLLLIDILNPLKNSDDAMHKLNVFKSLLQTNTQIQGLVGRALDLHKEPHLPLLVWLKTIVGQLFMNDVNTTYKDITRMIQILDLYAKVTDVELIKDVIEEAKIELAQALHLISPMKDAGAKDMALIEDFRKKSPPLLWKIMQREYGIQEIGPNVPTASLAADLKNGKHNDKLLLNYLYDYTDFILNASAKSGFITYKTWLRERRKQGRDILPVQRFDELNRVLVTNPYVGVLDNILQGSAYVLTKRKQIAIEAKKENQEADRITIVGFDTSGSMSGGNDEFQAGLIAAFVSRALNDISPSGRHRHRVLLVPFDDHVRTPIKVHNMPEALDLIANHQRLLANTGAGTNIQAFLLQAMKLISEAQDRKQPFHSANIVLMTDGEAPIDYKELKKARESIHRNTPLQTMFIALGSSNNDLKAFAQDSKKMGADHGFYKEFSGNDIHKCLHEGKKIDAELYEKFFYTTQTADRIPPQTQKHVASAYRKVEHLASAVQTRMTYQSITAYREILSQQLMKKLYDRGPQEGWVYETRQFIAKHKAFHDEKTIGFILYNLMLRFEEIAGQTFKELTHYTTQQLVHLLERPLEK